MELKDTVELMNSEDYKDRFKAEYLQTKIRCEKLHMMLVKLDAGMLEFAITCPAINLKQQERAMQEYLKTLEIRAVIEGIDLTV